MTKAIFREALTRNSLLVCTTMLGLVVVAAVAKLCLEFGLAWRCPLFALFSVPCPSCGSTRAFAALAGFDLIAALKFNPLIVAGIGMLPLLATVKRWPDWVQRNGWTIFGALVAVNWVYLFLFLPR